MEPAIHRQSRSIYDPHLSYLKQAKRIYYYHLEEFNC